MYEVTFVNNVVSWINTLLEKRLDLPFAKADIEESPKGSRKRHDFLLYSRDGTLALSGEVKLPEARDGQTPYNEAVVLDAHEKADSSGVQYFFTWNVNRLVLWKTFEQNLPVIQRDQHLFEVVSVKHSNDTRHAHIEARLKDFLTEFLTYYADIYRGVKVLPVKPLDERFIDMLDTALETIVFHTFDALYQSYQEDIPYRDALISWMVKEMGWTHSAETLDDDLKRAVKISCYRLVNKLMFYNALRRRFQALAPIKPSPYLNDGAMLHQQLEFHFQQAMVASGDYETVYTTEPPDEIPFLSPIALSGWLNLIDHIEAYDFTRLDYDIVGRVFERLISPEERHRYGQHYTMPDLVDLINGFCVRDADARLLDPTCGGGTFLVRGYARKRYLSGGRLSHNQLLDQLYGVDISPFAAHLALMNLAVRDLSSEANYPLIAVDDFFKVRKEQWTFEVPDSHKVNVANLGQFPMRQIPLRVVDAVVGNPPYIRQELIDDVLTPPMQMNQEMRYKDFLKLLFQEEWGRGLNPLDARSDLHVHFWPHATTFLREGGYFGFLTSSGWLDNVYGFRLQEFILQKFQVVAILESVVEPWFTEARVNTTATILRRTDDAQARLNNPVRFVQLRKKLSDLLPQTEDETRRQRAVDELVKELESITTNTKDERWRIRVVQQHDLALEGWTFPDEAETPLAWDGEWHTLKALGGEYTGHKWGIYLRAPDLFFDLLDTFEGRLAPLHEIAVIKRGITSGADQFFYVEDITDTLNEATLLETYGLTRADTETMRVVHAGDGSAHLIEAKYLAPLVSSVMELNGPTIDKKALRRHILLVDESPQELEGTQVKHYIQYGEQEGFHNRPTCKGRIRRDEDGTIIQHWYELHELGKYGAVAWPKAHQYRHIVAANPDYLPLNCRLYSIDPHNETEVPLLLLGAILNSTLIAWIKEIYGRVLGREGNTDTMVVDVKAMPVPNPYVMSLEAKSELITAIERLMQRPSLPIYPMGDELEQADRVALDDALFEALGLTDAQERTAWRERLYSELKHIYQHKRELEEIAMRNRVKASRKGRTASARTLAQEIWRELDKDELRRFPDDFVAVGIPTSTLTIPEGEILVGEHMFTVAGLVGVGDIQVGEEALIHVGSLSKAQYVKAWQEAGNTGKSAIPQTDADCDGVLSAYAEYHDAIEQQLYEWAASRTPDEHLQYNIVRTLWKHIAEYLHA